MAVPLLDCTIKEEPEVIVLHVRGEVDLATAPILRSHLQRLVEAGRQVIVDLSETSYFDMSGVRFLEQTHQLLSERRCLLVAVSPSPVVRRLFALVELDRIMPLLQTTEEAREFLQRSNSRLREPGDG